MKVILDQQLLLSCLKTVSRAVSTTNTLPVLGNILLKAEGKKLHFAATNQEMYIQTSCDAAIKNEGSLTVPAKLLTSYISLLPNTDEVTISATGDNALEIKSKASRTKIKGIPESEFPDLPAVTGGVSIALPVPAFHSLVHKVSFAAQENASRPVLGGVFVAIEGTNVRMAATDSYRLSEVELKTEKAAEPVNCLIPVRALLEADRLSQKEETIELKITANQIAIQAGSTTLGSRLIDGVFPDYKAIIPKKHLTSAVLDRGELELAVRRLSIFARQNNQHMKLDIGSDSVRVTSDSTEIGEDESTISATVTGASNVMALNADYLLEVLSAASSADSVIIEMQEKMNPAVIKIKGRDDFLHLIMPLKM